MLLRNLLFVVAVLAVQVVLAQQQYSTTNTKAIKAYESAIKAFDARNSELALSLLADALKRDPKFVEAHLIQFEVYVEGGKFEPAAQALRDAIAINPDFFPNAWFFLGTLELKMGGYEASAKSLNKFKTYRNTNPELRTKADELLSTCGFALEAIRNPVPFEPLNLGSGINTSMPEYYPCITADGRTLLYTRLTDDPKAFRGKNEDFYVSRFEDGAWQQSRPLREINTLFNEGAPALSADGRVLVFTACEILGDYGPGRTGKGSCDLFIAYRTGSRWSEPMNMGTPINTRNWETQPSLSADGRTLYFIRGMVTPEGVKNQDIFVTTLTADGQWTKPESLGRTINTPGTEESVMIHPDGRTLYFASDGHQGMGGTDLFVSRLGPDGKWQKPQNLGYPINTHNDENSLLVGPDGSIAFFASDRAGGFGKLDLYSFELPKEVRPAQVTYAEGIVVDHATGEPLAARLELYDVNDSQRQYSFFSDPQDGSFLMALPTATTFGLSVKSDGYLFHSETFELMQPDASRPYAIEVRLKKPKAGTAIVLRNVFFDTDKDELKAQSVPELVELSAFLINNPGLRIEIGGHTDNQGGADYNQKLSERRAIAVKQHLVQTHGIAADRIATQGYGQQAPIASNDTEEGRSLNRRTAFTVLK